MATAHTNKPNSVASSSPPILGKQNPRLRNSESIDPMRRSVGSNLFAKPSINANPRGFNNTNPTPANSPSDFPRRNSIGGRDMNQTHNSFVEKENDRGHNPNVARAPSTPKGAKNFMSPTISAASKINPSPRKKILAEKNEPARHSVSFSDIISIIGADDESTNQTMQPDHDLTVTDFDLKETLSDLEFDQDSSFKISPRPPCSESYAHNAVAPLDADPLMPPYDPKTNYLSPRPRFLHYKPNPKVELELNEGKQLEEIFASLSSSSDNEVSETETESVTSVIHSEDVVSQRVEEETTVEEEEQEEHLQEVATELKGSTEKAQGFGMSKLLVWLLVLAAVCSVFSAAFYLGNQEQLSMLQDSSFYASYVPSDVAEFARSNLEQMGQKFKTWSDFSYAYILKLIAGLGEDKEIRPLRFRNLTDLFEDQSFDPGFHFTVEEAIVAEPNELGMEISETYEIEADEDIDEDKDEVSDISGYEEPVMEEEDDEEECNLGACEIQKEMATEWTENQNDDEQKQEMVETDDQQQATNAEVGSDVASEIQLPEESAQESDVASVIQALEAPKLITILENEFATKASNDEIISSQVVVVQASEARTEIDESYKEVGSGIVLKEYGGLANLPLVKNVLLGFLTMLVLVAAISFFSSKKAKHSAPTPAAVLHPDTSSRFQKNSRKGLEEDEQSEAQSEERRSYRNNSFRTESLASSASEYSVSHSYGSFTTYEKIPIKIGKGDEEEVITPVRRSSRLRKQASSSSAY